MDNIINYLIIVVLTLISFITGDEIKRKLDIDCEGFKVILKKMSKPVF